MNTFSNSIQMSTQLLEEFSSEKNDIRFTKVKIWLMHLGKNRNGSMFNKEVVEQAIPTLANTPIMASIGYDWFDEDKDFKGHESDIEITENGELKLINKTVPFGVIPETNNAKFETRLGDDMVEREYLTCEGILWNKWDDAVDIIYNKRGVTGQSMELSNDYTGYYDGEHFIFDSFSFYGACLLGEDIEPAMQNSVVEIKYATSTQDLIKEKLKVFNTLDFSTEGGKILNKKDLKFDEDTEEEPVVDGQEDDSTTDPEPDDIPEKDENPKESESGDNSEDSDDSPHVPEEPIEPTQPTSPESETDLVTVIDQTVDDAAQIHKEIIEDQDNLPEAKDLITIAGVDYSIDSLEEKLNELNTVKSKFESLQKEVHKEKVEKLFSTHKDNLNVESLQSLRAKSSDISIEELETQIFAEIGRKSYSNVKPTSAIEDKSIQFPHVSIKNNTTASNTLEEIVASWK